MSVFIDTGVFYAHHDTDASRHDIGVEALNTVLRESAYGHVLTSEYVYNEVVTPAHRRTGDIAAGIEVGRRIRGVGYPDAIELLLAHDNGSKSLFRPTRSMPTTGSASPTQ